MTGYTARPPPFKTRTPVLHSRQLGGNRRSKHQLPRRESGLNVSKSLGASSCGPSRDGHYQVYKYGQDRTVSRKEQLGHGVQETEVATPIFDDLLFLGAVVVTDDLPCRSRVNSVFFVTMPSKRQTQAPSSRVSRIADM